MRDFATLCGRAPLPPQALFGLVFSRWPVRECVGDAATVREHDFRGKKCQAAYVDIADKRQARAFMDICHGF